MVNPSYYEIYLNNYTIYHVFLKKVVTNIIKINIYLHERSPQHLLPTDSSTKYRLANEGAFHILQLLAVNLVTLKSENINS